MPTVSFNHHRGHPLRAGQSHSSRIGSSPRVIAAPRATTEEAPATRVDVLVLSSETLSDETGSLRSGLSRGLRLCRAPFYVISDMPSSQAREILRGTPHESDFIGDDSPRLFSGSKADGLKSITAKARTEVMYHYVDTDDQLLQSTQSYPNWKRYKLVPEVSAEDSENADDTMMMTESDLSLLLQWGVKGWAVARHRHGEGIPH
eukprot:CAMPEP_0167782962 /NCGR_PEP_ID=MMETSP0111_2-20121227/6810_1 /TAXON_ID=91324 /ORGANISM="Lotharella globosa, Strain CCCM811" /LENGTH=203 /DNA_ID=CAMNT_0007673855 /DNA_START=9 /DNA_END=620 /DNA_ORIENTATION=-